MAKREIKFRAWDTNTKIMFPVLEMSFRTCYDVFKVWAESIVDGIDGRLINPCDTILMQYTGLKDCNGKEIYEGDIVQTSSDDILVVTWVNRFASFCLQKDGWLHDHYFGEAVEPMDCVIIGNIYENPELLKGE